MYSCAMCSTSLLQRGLRPVHPLGVDLVFSRCPCLLAIVHTCGGVCEAEPALGLTRQKVRLEPLAVDTAFHCVP